MRCCKLLPLSVFEIQLSPLCSFSHYIKPKRVVTLFSVIPAHGIKEFNVKGRVIPAKKSVIPVDKRFD
jgi:hypothetical protein